MRRAFGETSPDFADVLAFRCDYRISTRRYADAARDCQRVIDILGTDASPDRAKLATAQSALARVHALEAAQKM
jgi:hypothetical protein